MKQLKKADINEKLIELLEEAQACALTEGANSKDKTLYYKMLCDLGALDNIIAEEHEEIFDIAKSNVKKFKLPEKNDIKKQAGL